MLGNHVLHRHVPFGDGSGEHEGTRLYLVGDDGIFRAVEPCHPPDPDHVRAGSLDVGAAAVQEVGHVHHMGLFRAVLDDGHAVRQSGSHHDVDGSAHADTIHIDMLPVEMLCPDLHQPMLNHHFRPQGPETFDMLVDGPAADIAASRQDHLRLFIFSQKGPQEIIGTPDLLAPLVLYYQIVDISCIQHDAVPVVALHRHADSPHGLQQDVHVAHVRNIFYIYGLIRHGGCGQNRKRGILGACDLHVPHQGIPTFYNILFHSIFLCFGPDYPNNQLSLVRPCFSNKAYVTTFSLICKPNVHSCVRTLPRRPRISLSGAAKDRRHQSR